MDRPPSHRLVGVSSPALRIGAEEEFQLARGPRPIGVRAWAPEHSVAPDQRRLPSNGSERIRTAVVRDDGGEVDGRTLLSEVLHVAPVITEQIADTDLARPSRCDGWSIGDVLDHAAAVTEKFTTFARAETDVPKQRAPAGSRQGAQQRLRAASEQSVVAWMSADVTRICQLGFGEFDAATAAGINAFDLLAHLWDVADPLGLDLVVDDVVWSAALVVARRVIGEGTGRDTAHYAPRRPARGDARERFLAFLGRCAAGEGAEASTPST